MRCWPLVLCLLGGSAMAAELAPSKQATLLLRALAYDDALSSRVSGTANLVVVCAPDAFGSCAKGKELVGAFEALAAEFSLAGLPVQVTLHKYVNPEALAGDLTGAAAVYLSPACEPMLAAIVTLAAETGVPTMTGTISYISEGVAVGVVQRGNSAKLVVNLPASKAQGAALNARMLAVADVRR